MFVIFFVAISFLIFCIEPICIYEKNVCKNMSKLSLILTSFLIAEDTFEIIYGIHKNNQNQNINQNQKQHQNQNQNQKQNHKIQ